jgi:hypothetical protein
MKRTALFLILFLVSACAGAPSQAAATETQPLATQTIPFNVGGVGLMPVTEAVIPATATQVPPTLTETLLPPLELPTPAANAPSLLAWDGQPTYVGDSKPDYYFRVKYDPDIWALTTDNYGFPALAHRGIEYCVIAPASGGGLPLNMRVEHDIVRFGSLAYDVSTVYNAAGEKQFVTYTGGDGNIYTGFQVTFQQDADLCIKEAEGVLSTLTSVLIVRATPAAPGP